MLLNSVRQSPNAKCVESPKLSSNDKKLLAKLIQCNEQLYDAHFSFTSGDYSKYLSCDKTTCYQNALLQNQEVTKKLIKYRKKNIQSHDLQEQIKELEKKTEKHNSMLVERGMLFDAVFSPDFPDENYLCENVTD